MSAIVDAAQAVTAAAPAALPAVGAASSGVLHLAQNNLAQTVLAIGALGTAAYGLVDASKALWGGVSNAGFNHIAGGLAPYRQALDLATGGGWREMLRAHWINGRSKEDQKSIVRALVRLGLSEATAGAVAEAARVDPVALKAVAVKVAKGQSLTETERNVLGRFDVVFESQMDAAFERADQQYKSSARALAGVAAVGVAFLVLLFDANWAFSWANVWLAVTVGVLAVPLAPIAKDLASALNAAVKAVRGGA